MYRIDNDTAVAELPVAEAPGTPGFFSEGNPQSGTPPTIVTADWANTIQEELVNLVEEGGLSPDKADNTQIHTAILALIQAALDAVIIQGSYTGTLTGLTTSPTVDVEYTIIGDVVTLVTGQNVEGTSNISTFTITGAPAAIRPAVNSGPGFCVLTDAGALTNAGVIMDTDGNLIFLVDGNSGAFTDSGTKGLAINRRVTFTYRLAGPA